MLTTDIRSNTSVKKDTRWKWSEKEQIKDAFEKVMHLNHTDVTLPYYLTTDASAYAIGASLYQVNESNERNVIAYYSRNLVGPEINYTVTEKEALSIVTALRN